MYANSWSVNDLNLKEKTPIVAEGDLSANHPDKSISSMTTNECRSSATDEQIEKRNFVRIWESEKEMKRKREKNVQLTAMAPR